MRRFIAMLFIGTFATPSYAQNSAELGPDTKEHLFQCGATFAIMAKIYQEAGQLARSAGYQTKFDKLAVRAEDAFVQTNRSKSDAEDYMQKHVDTLAAIAEKDAKLILNFSQVCDQRFPS